MYSEGGSSGSGSGVSQEEDPAAMYAAAAAGFRGLLGAGAAAAAIPSPFPQVQYFAGNGPDKPPTALAFHSKTFVYVQTFSH